jgi:hypothetical protein
MATYGFLILFFTENYIAAFLSPMAKLLIILITFIFTFVLPVLNALLLLRMGRISSLSMPDPKERILPYGSTALYYLALFLLYFNQDMPVIFRLLILGAFLSIVITLLITLKWKISAHATGIAGLAGAALGLMIRLNIDLSEPLMIIIIVAGFVGYARLRLNAHEPAQVYMGYLLGFLAELLLMIFCP